MERSLTHPYTDEDKDEVINYHKDTKTNYLPPEMIRKIISILDKTNKLEDEIEKLRLHRQNWHSACCKCASTKHNIDWVYCLVGLRAYCDTCSPSFGCDCNYCPACNGNYSEEEDSSEEEEQ